MSGDPVELVARSHVLSCCEQRLVFYFLGWDQVAVSCCDEESMHLANHSRVGCEVGIVARQHVLS